MTVVEPNSNQTTKSKNRPFPDTSVRHLRRFCCLDFTATDIEVSVDQLFYPVVYAGPSTSTLCLKTTGHAYYDL